MAVATDGSPAISIIIPCRDHAVELADCLQGLKQQDCTQYFEVIVVDSAWDPAVEAAVRKYPHARLIRSDSKEPLSAGAARNLGALHANARLLGFIDADCVPHQGWVKAALDAMETGAVLAGGAILDQSPWRWIASTDNRLQFVDFPARRPPGAHPYLPGAQLVISRGLFKDSGMFDESALVAQDVLFTASIAAAFPGRVRFCPRMIVYHPGRASWRDFLRHQKDFGRARSNFGLQMRGDMFWLGQREYLAWIITLRRLVYITMRVIQWNTLDLPRFLWQLPAVLIGLVAWTQGFYAGMRERTAREESS